MTDQSLYKEWRDKLLRLVSEEVCKPCTDPNKQDKCLDYSNPLACECRCYRVDDILAKAAQIDADIIKYGQGG